MSQTPIDSQNRAPAMPRWVKISVVIVVAIVILFAVLHLSGAHGPESHMPMGDHDIPVGSPTP